MTDKFDKTYLRCKNLHHIREIHHHITFLRGEKDKIILLVREVTIFNVTIKVNRLIESNIKKQ